MPLPPRVTVILLGLGLSFGLMVLAGQVWQSPLPGNQQGYEPRQPIAFSHRLHAGTMKIDCQYCHAGAESGRHAGLPSSGTCMNCHASVTATLGAVRDEEARAKAEGRDPRLVVSPELRKLYDSLGLDESLKPVPGKEARPLEWQRVQALPAFACFDHRSHVGAGVACQQCHGPVESMERVRQQESLSMGWCIQCHREAAQTGIRGKAVKPPMDCVSCHN